MIRRRFFILTARNLYSISWQIITDPDLVALVRRAYSQGVVMDTWMHGEWQAEITREAQRRLEDMATGLASQVSDAQTTWPIYPLSTLYLAHLFQAVLTSMALFTVHRQSDTNQVTESYVEQALATLTQFASEESWGLHAVVRVFHVIWSFEDLNALRYFRRLPRAEFLSGVSHRPWVQELLADQLSLYLRMGVVKESLTGKGEMLRLTPRGHHVLAEIERVLEESGELAWRANQQRWDVFRTMDYDTVFNVVGPDSEQATRDFLDHLPIKPGMQVLEVGAGTGRVCVDLGLCERVLPGGQVVAVEPSAAMGAHLQDKCERRAISNVQIVKARAEDLPFADQQFDLTMAVAVLHFTDVDAAVKEMARVTKPGGRVAALVPPPNMEVREIPMVALWLRPLSELAEEFGLSFGERNGLPPGRLENAFHQASLQDVTRWPVPVTVTAEDYRAFFTFFVKGAAFFQHTLARLPYHERVHLLQNLEKRGEQIASQTQPAEKRHIYYGEAIWGRVPLP